MKGREKMAVPGKVDYHIHYYIDICAHDEMTLQNIEDEAARLGLEEVCVLKHYSAKLPNGEKAWVHWKQVVPEQFVNFLKDIRTYQQTKGVKMLAGVEAELLNDEGEINIEQEAMDKLDSVSLSVHWMPDLKILKTDPILYPGDIGKYSSSAADLWRSRIKEAGLSAIIGQYVSSYVKALEKNPKVRVLAHMNDGLNTLRSFDIMVDLLGEDKLVDLMEPIMKTCAEKKVLWEIAEKPVKCELILKRANELGVHFSATVDAHFLHAEGWSHLNEHYMIEEYIDSLGLTKGLISL